jgi:hypothetical protein
VVLRLWVLLLPHLLVLLLVVLRLWVLLLPHLLVLLLVVLRLLVLVVPVMVLDFLRPPAAMTSNRSSISGVCETALWIRRCSSARRAFSFFVFSFASSPFFYLYTTTVFCL